MAQVTIAMRFFVSPRAWVEVQPAPTRPQAQHLLRRCDVKLAVVPTPAVALIRQPLPAHRGGGGVGGSQAALEKRAVPAGQFH